MDLNDIHSIYHNYNDVLMKLNYYLRKQPKEKFPDEVEYKPEPIQSLKKDINKLSNSVKCEVNNVDVTKVEYSPKGKWYFIHTNVCPTCKTRQVKKTRMNEEKTETTKTSKFTTKVCNKCKGK